MKKIIKLIGFVTMFFIITVITNGNGRCESSCIPKNGGTCSFGTGNSDDPVAFCTGNENYKPLKPIEMGD